MFGLQRPLERLPDWGESQSFAPLRDSSVETLTLK